MDNITADNFTAAFNALAEAIRTQGQAIASAQTINGLFLILVLIVALLNALAFWQRHVFLYILAAIIDIPFGLYYAWQVDPLVGAAQLWSATFITGALITVIGFFCVFRTVMKLIGR